MSKRFSFFLVALVGILIGWIITGHPLGALGGGALPFMVGMSVQTDSDIVRQLIAWGILDQAGGYKLNIVAKTADYIILSPLTAAGDRSGTIFTNRGAAGAVNFTLPVIVAAMRGTFYEFIGAADQSFGIVSSPADTLTVVNDAAADSLTVSTAAHKIGAHMRVVCDGTAWFAYGDSVGDTFTVAT